MTNSDAQPQDAEQDGEKPKAQEAEPHINLLSQQKNAAGLRLSSYDLAKFIAFALILLNTIGEFVLGGGSGDGGVWLRTVGVMGVPILCFLIGYSGSRDMSLGWVLAGIVVSALNVIFHLPVFPADMIMTLVLCSVLVLPFALLLERYVFYFWYIMLLVLFMAPVSSLLFAYGTSGLLFAFVGFAIRNRTAMDETFRYGISDVLLVVTYLCFVVVHIWQFGFSVLQITVFAVFSALVMLGLRQFKAEYSDSLTMSPFAGLIQFVSLNLLYLYILQLLVFKTLNAGFSAIGALFKEF